MDFAQKLAFLTALVRTAKERMKIPAFYFKKFEASNNEYLTATEEINIDDMINHFVVAGVVSRGEALPLIGKDGFNRTKFTPDIIGGKFPYTASDLLEVQAGAEVFTTDPKTRETKITKMTMENLEVKYADIVNSAIENRKERQAVDCYLKGIYIDAKKKVFEVGQKTNKTVTWTSKVKSDEVIKLVQDYINKFGTIPKVEAGTEVFNAIKKEAQDVKTNINGVSYAMTAEGQKLSIGNFAIEMLVSAKGSDDTMIDTSKMLIVSDPNSLAVGYAGIMYGDINSNETKIVKSKLVVAPLRVTVEGQSGIFAMSAPMPVILSLDKFTRYTVTL